MKFSIVVKKHLRPTEQPVYYMLSEIENGYYTSKILIFKSEDIVTLFDCGTMFSVSRLADEANIILVPGDLTNLMMFFKSMGFQFSMEGITEQEHANKFISFLKNKRSGLVYNR